MKLFAITGELFKKVFGYVQAESEEAVVEFLDLKKVGSAYYCDQCTQPLFLKEEIQLLGPNHLLSIIEPAGKINFLACPQPPRPGEIKPVPLASGENFDVDFTDDSDQSPPPAKTERVQLVSPEDLNAAEFRRQQRGAEIKPAEPRDPEALIERAVKHVGDRALQ